MRVKGIKRSIYHTKGTPQGGCSSPYLWACVINDLIKLIKPKLSSAVKPWTDPTIRSRGPETPGRTASEGATGTDGSQQTSSAFGCEERGKLHSAPSNETPDPSSRSSPTGPSAEPSSPIPKLQPSVGAGEQERNGGAEEEKQQLPGSLRQVHQSPHWEKEPRTGTIRRQDFKLNVYRNI